MPNKQLTTQDQQFLYATFCTGQKAEEAWKAWRTSVDFDQSAPRYAPLIPLLYNNLIRLGLTDPLCGRFKGFQRRFWYKNQLLLRRACHILCSWQRDNIQALCFSDVALACHHYSNIGMRSIQRLQFLIQPEQIDAAVQHLVLDGWQFITQLSAGQGYRYKHSDQMTLELYTDLLLANVSTASVNSYWVNKVPLEIQTVTAHTLSPTDHLIYYCSQPPQEYSANFIWIADVLTLLNNPRTEIDWTRMSSSHLSHDLYVRVRTSLNELWTKYDAAMPPNAVPYF